MTTYRFTPPQSPRPKCSNQVFSSFGPGCFFTPILESHYSSRNSSRMRRLSPLREPTFRISNIHIFRRVEEVGGSPSKLYRAKRSLNFRLFFFYKPETYWTTLLFMCIQVNPSLYDSLLEAWSFAIKAFLRVGTFRCRVVPTYWLAHGFSGEKIYEIN